MLQLPPGVSRQAAAGSRSSRSIQQSKPMHEIKLLLAAMAGLALAVPPANDWPTQNRDLAGTRYSPLTQIHTGNVNRLSPAWTFRLRSDDRAPFQASEA